MRGSSDNLTHLLEIGGCEMRRVEEGQGMVEYALVITLVALAVVASLALLGPAVMDAIQAGIDAFP
jgi:Flp pilus assembly pilin Flp